MEKKRKRPSFTIPSTPAPKPAAKPVKEEPVDEEPAMKQVVEVVVPKTKPGDTPSPINIVIPPQSVVVKQGEETKLEVKPEVKAPPKQVVEPVMDELPVVDGVDDAPSFKLNDRAQELMDEDDESTVTASATPEGDTVVVREDAEEDIPQSPPVHQTIEEVKEELPEETERETEEQSESMTQQSQEVEEHIKPPITVHKAPEVSERQQEQVAELFGKTSQSVMPEITVHHHSNTRGIILWAITMIAIALGVGGGLVLFTSRSAKEQTPIAVISPTPTQAPVVPTATPTPVPVNKEEIKIQVLNGGGVAGAGGRMRSFLEELGYTVLEAKNAESYTYENTDIIIKESMADQLDIIRKDIAESYEIGETDTTLPESSAYDVRVIVGENE